MLRGEILSTPRVRVNSKFLERPCDYVTDNPIASIASATV